MERPTRPPAPQRREAITAAVCWSVAVLALLALALVADVDPETAGDVPGVGSLAWWTAILVITGQAVALLWVRAAPRVALVLVAAIPLVFPVPLLLSGSSLGGAFTLTSFAVAVASYVAFVERPLSVARPAGILAAVLAFAAYLVAGVHDGEVALGIVVATSVGQAVVIVGGPVLVALLVTTRRDIREAREHELHDIAAHHLSGIAIMAAAIERQIATDPASATEGIRHVRTQSTAVLRDLRRLVGLLREGDAAELSVETLDGIAPLAAQATATGRAVELVTLAPGGDVGRGVGDDLVSLGAGLGPLAQLTAYRLVQESLANAVQHAPGAACRVTIDDRDPEVVVLTVHNDAGSTAPPTSRTGGGFGLAGMHERAALTASELRYGPTIDGGWDVCLRLPRDTTGIETSS